MKKLTIDWWISQRNVPKFRQALSGGFAQHCFHVIKQGLIANKQKGLWPDSWNSYMTATVLASNTNLRRKRGGETATQVFECIGMATLIDATPQQLSPPECRSWLVTATRLLSGGVPDTQVELFVDYCLHQLAKHRQRQFGLSVRQRWNLVELPVERPAVEDFAVQHDLKVDDASKAIKSLKEALEKCL